MMKTIEMLRRARDTLARAPFKTKTIKTFTASSEDRTKHNGPVEVIRPLTIEEVDIEEVGPMFKCRSPNGEFDAFGDELA